MPIEFTHNITNEGLIELTLVLPPEDNKMSSTISIHEVNDQIKVELARLKEQDPNQKIKLILPEQQDLTERRSDSTTIFKITEITQNAYSYTPNLHSMHLAQSIEKIQDKAFYSCSITSINLDHIKSIGAHSFQMSSLKSLTFSSNIQKIGSQAFHRNRQLQHIEFSDEVPIDQNLEIESWAFAQCKNLSTVNFPKNLKIITPHSFQGCKKLKMIQLPENIEEIQNKAFLGCDMLEQVTIYSQLTHLSPCAFQDCPKVTFKVEDINKTYITDSTGNSKNIIEIALEAKLHWAVTDLIFQHKDSLQSDFLEKNKLPILASVLKSVFDEISDSQDDKKIQVATDALNFLLSKGSFNICDQNSAVCQEIFNLLIQIGNEDLLTRILQKQRELKPFENSENSTVQSVLKKIKQNDLKEFDLNSFNPHSYRERVNRTISNTTASFLSHGELKYLGMLNKTRYAQSARQNPEHTAITFSKQTPDSNQSQEKKTKTSQNSAGN